MVRSRLGLKALGLCALVVGLMALSSGVAQAEESGGKWTYTNAAGGELKELPNNQTIGGKIETGTDGTLLTKIAGVKVEFLCKSFTVDEGILITGGTALGALTFHECTTKLNGSTSGPCEPKSEGHLGLIKTLKLKGTLLLHKLTSDGKKDKIFIVEPDTGSNAFAHIQMGEECSIGEDVLVGGKFAIIDCKGEGEKHLKEHLITEFAPLTHLWTVSDTPEHAATIDGSAFVFLTGANANLPWASLWN